MDEAKEVHKCLRAASGVFTHIKVGDIGGTPVSSHQIWTS